MKESRGSLRLESCDGPAHGRSRKPQLARGKRESAAIDDAHEGAEVVQVEVFHAPESSRSPFRADYMESTNGATTSRVSLLETTGTISNVAPDPRHMSVHSWKRRRSLHSIN